MSQATVLDAAHLFDRSLPATFAPLVERLAKIASLRKGPRETRDERSREAQALYEELLNLADVAREPTPDRHLPEAREFQRWFTEAVVLWGEFAKTSSAPLIDSVGARTLASFPLDLPLEEGAVELTRKAAKRAFSWDDQEFSALLAHVEHVTSNLALKRRLTQAFADHVEQAGLNSDAGRLSLMRAFYGDLPFAPGEVDLLVTSTSIVFFLPRQGKVLEEACWDRRSDAERAAVLAFFERLDKANVAETERFPAFGFGDRSLLRGELMEQLSNALEVPVKVVTETIRTMFSVVPTRLRSQYLVHDTWGHTWQEALSEFELEFELLPRTDAPLDPAAQPLFTGDGEPRLADAFRNERGKTTFDAAAFENAARADLRARLRVGASFVLAEVFADFMESKYSRAHPEAPLPTSSLVPSTSLKIDLSLIDARRQVRRATEPYEKLAREPEAQRVFSDGLAALGLPEQGRAEAVAAAARLVEQALVPLFGTELRVESLSEPDRIASTFYCRIMLQLSLLMTELEQILSSGQGTPQAWRNPASCPDLFAIAFCHFYEQDRVENFWHLDQVARDSIERGCFELREALGH